jgi:hypothetical protein
MSDTLVGMLNNPSLQLKLLFGVSSGAVCAHVIITDKSDDDLFKEVSWLKYVCPLEAWMPELTKANMLQLVTDLPVLTTVDMHMTPVVDRHSENKPAKVFKGATRIPASMLAMLWSYLIVEVGVTMTWGECLDECRLAALARTQQAHHRCVCERSTYGRRESAR